MTPLNILILCTGNSCRSILGEVLFNELGDGRVQACSAGSQPAGAVNPRAIEKLAAEGHAVVGLASKSWDTFSGPDAPALDIVITVCDSAAGETCPVWSGGPITVHWGIPDPADAIPDEAEAAFERSSYRSKAWMFAICAMRCSAYTMRRRCTKRRPELPRRLAATQLFRQRFPTANGELAMRAYAPVGDAARGDGLAIGECAR